ncbi:hypothetical protein [Candidatus Protochlamydia amoebophila]|uniref:hypothetical protein n=1 Tax=Candidatus Protochlamydia amoebophila TaxID=362787 RepID=UPI001BC8D971|nr:hypothetical protein [Candidatus Protochlamydia amoebophila]
MEKAQASRAIALASQERTQTSREKTKIIKGNFKSKTKIMTEMLFYATFGKKLDPAQVSQTVRQYVLDRAINLEIEKKS